MIVCMREADVFYDFKDDWLDIRSLRNMSYRGMESENVHQLRIGAGDADPAANSGKDKSIADAYGNRYSIPLDIDLLNAHHPFYPSGLSDHGKVVKSSDDTAEYMISDLALEYEVVTN